jgi:hypothetical protein
VEADEDFLSCLWESTDLEALEMALDVAKAHSTGQLRLDISPPFLDT